MNPRIAVLLGALLAATGVGLGAYHAHGLGARLESAGVRGTAHETRMHHGDVGVRYQMFHALGLLAIGALSAQCGSKRRSKCLAIAGWCLFFGVALFSGGLYFMVLRGHVGHWAIVPAGGLLLIVGWCALATHACFCWREPDAPEAR